MRLFVALDLPEEVRQSFRDLIAALKRDCPGVRWVRPEGIHVTLKFIGITDDKNLEAICTALSFIASDAPVEMRFQGLGFFPNERQPRVVWCGVEASANLATLATAVGRSLEPGGVPPESRPFVPHLTLARVEPGKISTAEVQKLSQAARAIGVKVFGSIRETKFYLFESILEPGGAQYRRLREFPFVKGSA